jgi:hypothetical protein
MKKPYSILLIVLVLFIFACDFEIPTSIEVRATPSFTFTTDLDFSEVFTKMIEGAFEGNEEGLRILNCTHKDVPIKTLLIRMEIFHNDEMEIDIGGGDQNVSVGGGNPVDLLPEGSNYKLQNDLNVFDSDTPVIAKLSKLTGYMKDFEIDTEKIESKVYIGGSSIVNALTIDMKFTEKDPDGGPDGSPRNHDFEPGDKELSGVLDIEGDDYFETAELPEDGEEVEEITDAIKDRKDIEIWFNVYLNADTKINLDWLKNDQHITAELVIWLPLKLIAQAGAELIFPESSFSAIGDVIKSISGSGAIDSFSLTIEMNENPFEDGTMIIRNTDGEGNPIDGVEISNQLSANTFPLAITEEHIKYINENDFKPEFLIRFDDGGIFNIPHEFKVISMSMDLKLRFVIDLSKGG